MAKNKGTIAAPNILKPFDKDDKSSIQVVIETPKGSRNKYEFDPKLRSFTLSRVLPGGMVFPYDFGFVPSTLAEDGDPIDVLLPDGFVSIPRLRGREPIDWRHRRRAEQGRQEGTQ